MGFIKDFILSISILVGSFLTVICGIGGLVAYSASDNPTSVSGLLDPSLMNTSTAYGMFFMSFIFLVITAYLGRMRRKGRIRDQAW
ncbi:MAG: hypothetical protein ACTSW1_07855 [Candidatus Hodarchaeales archaeon]